MYRLGGRGHIYSVLNNSKCNLASAKALRKARLGFLRSTGRKLAWRVPSEQGRGVLHDAFGGDEWIQRKRG